MESERRSGPVSVLLPMAVWREENWTEIQMSGNDEEMSPRLLSAQIVVNLFLFHSALLRRENLPLLDDHTEDSQPKSGMRYAAQGKLRFHYTPSLQDLSRAQLDSDPV